MTDWKEIKKNYNKKLRELKQQHKIKGANKYKAERSGNKPSKLENSIDGMIRLYEKAGEWRLDQAQYNQIFYVNGIKIISYRLDFKLTDLKTNEPFGIEGKGDQSTYDWMVKRNLWRALGPFKLLVYSGHHSSPQLVETIIPVLSEIS